MRNVSFSSLVVRNVADAATSPAPVVATETAKPATVKRKLAAPKPAAAKPASKPAKPVIAKPVSGKLSEAAKPSANVTRTAATIAAQACNFGNLSDRDNAYMRFYAGIAKAATGGVVSLRAIVDSGKRPNYNGSNKPHDAGVIQRLAKAGLVTIRDNGAAFVFTKLATTHASYAKA